MEDQYFIKIMKIYESFKSKLNENINNSLINISSGDYYIIEEYYLNELEQKITNYNKNKSSKNINYSISLPDQKPEIINNFSDLINCLKNNRIIRLISKEFMELINNKNNLNNSNYVQYFCGNEKLIIEYKMNNEKKGILFINPFNKTLLKENIFIIIKNNQQKSLYEELLANSNNNLFQSYINNKYIIPLEKYDNIKINNNNITNKDIDFKKDLLKIFILIFYYEKYLDQNKEKVINEKQKYYFVDPNWLNKYKEYYNYAKFYEMINAFYMKNSKINYSNLDKNINYIINDFLEKDTLNFDKKELSKDLREINNIRIKILNIKFVKNAIIVPSKIMNIIIKWNKNIVLYSKKLLYKEQKIFNLYNPYLIIGNLNNNNIFIPKYIFVYNSKEIYDSEKKIFLSTLVNEYIAMRKCEENLINKPQILKNDNNEELGQFIIYLNNIETSGEKTKILKYCQTQSNMKKKRNISINNTYSLKTIKKKQNSIKRISIPYTPKTNPKNVNKSSDIKVKNLFGVKKTTKNIMNLFLLKNIFILNYKIRHLYIKSLIIILNYTYTKSIIEKKYQQKILEIKEIHKSKNRELMKKEEKLVEKIKIYQKQIEFLNKEKENNIINEVKKVKEQFEFSLFQIINNNKNKLNKLNVELLDCLNNEKTYEDKDFKDLKPISKGAYGTIYSAYSIKDNKEICLKRINIDQMKIDYENCKFPKDSYKKDLNNEIKILKLLSLYRNSVEYYGNYDKFNEKVIVMEKCDENLLEFIKKKGKMKIEDIKKNFINLNEIFNVMQDYHIIHRDLKLSNFLVKYNNLEKNEYIIKLSDYGIGKFSNDINFSGIKGTLETIAPEILLKKVKQYESIVDIFSLGVILYQLSHNLKHPFKKSEIEDICKKYIINYEIDNINIEFDKDIENKYFKDLIIKMIKLNPKHRLTWEQYFEHPFFK